MAERLGYLYLNTGAMYRAVALAFLRTDAEFSPERVAALLPTVHLDVRYEGGTMHMLLNDEDVTDELGRPEVGQGASTVATLAAVREKLVAEQQRLGRLYRRDPGVVLEGRDIGTVVFPDADIKIFMVADPEIRARRRHAELTARGLATPLDEVLVEIIERDRQDRERALSPLRKADDALELDTTHQSIDAQVQFVVDRVRERENRRVV